VVYKIKDEFHASRELININGYTVVYTIKDEFHSSRALIDINGYIMVYTIKDEWLRKFILIYMSLFSDDVSKNDVCRENPTSKGSNQTSLVFTPGVIVRISSELTLNRKDLKVIAILYY